MNKKQQRNLKLYKIKKKRKLKGTIIRLTTDFISTTDYKWQWNNIANVLKENYCHARILYPSKLFQDEDKIKTFST